MPAPRSETRGSGDFKEAIAHWQLDVQTELKRASSLPTAMFDACDPMLETRLAEATESLFRCLLELDRGAAAGSTPEDQQRLEVVQREELAQMLREAAAGCFGAGPAPALDENDAGEFYAILAETCGRDQDAAAGRASALLGELESGGLQDLDLLAAAIARRIATAASHDSVIDGSAIDGAAVDGPAADALAADCRRIAAIVTGHAGRQRAGHVAP